MANQNVLQLTQQSGSANTTSVLYAVTGGTTDTGLPLTVLFNSPAITGTPTVAGYAALASANTYTANQTIGFSGSPTLILNDTAGTNFAAVEWAKAGQIQWWLNADYTGGVWCMNRYVGGSFQDKPISIANSTGLITMLSAAVTGNFTPSQTNGIVGTTTNNNANAGSIGEYITASGTSISLTTGTAINITSISLTAGDWDVSGVIEFNPAGSTVITGMFASVSTTTGTLGAMGQRSSAQTTHSAGVGDQLPTPVTRLSLASTTTVYLVANQFFSTSTCTASGLIRARRIR